MRLNRLLQRVAEEEQRADQERRLRVKERAQREQAEARAVQAEWGMAETAARLEEVSRQRGEAEVRASRAEQETEEATAGLLDAQKQLSAAVRYSHESDALLKAQHEQLRQLRTEVTVLREQVRTLSQEQQKPDTSNRVAEPATQVKPVNAPLAAASVQEAHEAAAASVQASREALWRVINGHVDAPDTSSPDGLSSQPAA